MSLEQKFYDEICCCENCNQRSLSSMLIAGHHFCSRLCYTKWKQKENLKHV